MLRDLIKAGHRRTGATLLGRAWKEIDRGQFTMAVDGPWMREQLRPLLEPGQAATVAMGGFSPLWEKTRTLAIGVNAIGGLKVDLLATCEAADDAKEVGDTIRAVLTLGRNTLRNLQQRGPDGPGTAPAADAASCSSPICSIRCSRRPKSRSRKWTSEAQSGYGRRPTSTSPGSSRACFPPSAAARAAARHSQGMNNLKQIGLAFHNYASANNQFPAAAGYAPNSKFPHSWRVATLAVHRGSAGLQPVSL